MRCPGCGSEMANDRRFCTNCGAALGDRTIEMKNVPPVPATPAPPEPTRAFAGVTGQQQTPYHPPATPSAGAVPAGKPGGLSRNSKIVIACVVALLVLGGAAAGIIIWRVSAGNKTIADISDLELSRADGEKLDLDRVPLDEDLELTATFTARFKEGGKATLKLLVADENGDVIVDESYTVKSSDDPREKTLEFSMKSGTGDPLEAKAELDIIGLGKTVSDAKSLEYTAVEGEGEETKLEKAIDKAADKLLEADAAVQDIADLGIEAGDLMEQVSDAEMQLEEATTVAEADTVYELAEGIIAECAARAADADGQDQEAANVQACRANQAAIRSALNAYYAAEGNFPDSMSDLVSGGYMQALPECPSGGTYTYQVTDFAGPTFDVTCSVHGSL